MVVVVPRAWRRVTSLDTRTYVRYPASMGYRGKLDAQEEARRLRALGRTIADIAVEVNAAKSSVSVWVRGVPFTPSPRRYGPQRRTHPQHLARLAEIAECDELGVNRIGTLGEAAFLAAGTALYAGEGS